MLTRAVGALEQLQIIIGLIREKWQDTHIIIRGDSAYSREDIMAWCESQKGVDYVLAMATNNQLKLRASDIIKKAQADYESRLKPVTKLRETLFSPDEKLSEANKLVPESTWYRSHCLSRTSLAKATVGTIRLSLLKLGARITISCRRILIAIATACPYQDIGSMSTLSEQMN
jgi:hypothetical protein